MAVRSTLHTVVLVLLGLCLGRWADGVHGIRYRAGLRDCHHGLKAGPKAGDVSDGRLLGGSEASEDAVSILLSGSALGRPVLSGTLIQRQTVVVCSVTKYLRAWLLL